MKGKITSILESIQYSYYLLLKNGHKNIELKNPCLQQHFRLPVKANKEFAPNRRGCR